MIHQKNQVPYYITDMGIAHLMTTDEMWVEICDAEELVVSGELLQFNSLPDAERFVSKKLKQTSHVQAIPASNVPWHKPSIDDFIPCIDWQSIKGIVFGVLDRAKNGSEEVFRQEAKSLGVSYEDFLAAAITQLISSEIENQLNPE